MPKYTPQQLREIYLKLPEDLKNAIFSVDSAEIIQNIGKKYNLPIDKTGELADETGLVMLGLTHPNNFISNLAQRLNTDKETARKIAEEVNNQIFIKVRESLKKIHGVSAEVGVPALADAGKEELLKEIEKEEPLLPTEKVPEIMKGVTQPFEAKTKEEVLRMPPVVSNIEPPEEKKYSEKDPYHEPIE